MNVEDACRNIGAVADKKTRLQLINQYLATKLPEKDEMTLREILDQNAKLATALREKQLWPGA